MIVIDHIDAIARRKQRDVLYVEFHPEDMRGRVRYPYQQDESRKKIIAWLEVNKIPWLLCGPYAHSVGTPPYRGEIYIDVPFNETLDSYRKVRDFLENPNGEMKWPGVRFLVLSLDLALKNSEHDEPGYWDLT